VGESELSIEDSIIYKRAKRIRNYLTQSLYVVEEQTGRPGKYVPLETTLKDVRDILNGSYDEVTDDRFLYIGEAKETKLL